MTVYVVAFALSSLLVQAAASRLITSGIVRVLVAAVPILIVSAVAGARDYGVGGPDALVYGNSLFTGAAGLSGFPQLVDYVMRLSIRGEHGYLALNFLVSRISDDPHVFYFFLAAFNASIVMAAIMLLRGYGPAGLMWLTYLCTAYVDSFNLLRQGPALALALLGIVLVIRRHQWWGLAVGLAGFLFHTSAFAFIPMWIVAVLLSRGDKAVKPGRALLIIVLAAVGMLASGYLLQVVGGSFAGGAYADYLTATAREGNAVGVEVLYRLVPIVAGVYVLATMRKPARSAMATITAKPDRFVGLDARQTALLVVVVLLIIELVMLPIREISYPLYRIPIYFGYVRIVAYTMIAASLRVHRLPGYFALIAFVGAYFILVVVMRSDGAYSSEIIDNLWR